MAPMHGRIRTRVWRNGTLETEGFPFEQVSDYLEEPDTLVWADLVNPDHETLCQLAEELSLDPHAVEDAMSHNERPKATRYATHLFLTANSLRLDDEMKLQVGRVSAFATRHAFVTVRLDGETVDIDDVVHRWDENSDLMKFGPGALMHGLLDEIVDRYFDVMDALDDKVEELEDTLFDDSQSTTTHRLSEQTFVLRRALVSVRRAVLPLRDVINTVSRHVSGDEHHATALAPYYNDLYDHILRVGDLTDALRESVTSVFDTSMSMADTRMNTIMKKLTAWAAIIAVPTAVTGWFGQNVPYPGFSATSGFWTSVVVIVIGALILYFSFKKRDWL